MILHANLASATPAFYDGTTLELAFPPGRTFAVEKVQAKQDELKAVLADVFGVSPAIRCVARDAGPGGPLIEEDDERPATQDEALRRL